MNQTLETIHKRYSARKFSNKPVEEKLLVEVLEAANRAPSPYNLQPWSFILVRDSDVKAIIRGIALNQAHVEEAPVVIVVLADLNFWKSGYPELLDVALADGSISPDKATRYRKNIQLLFDLGPFNCFGISKAIATHFRRYFKPTPHIPCSMGEVRAYVTAQTMLAVSTLLIAAKSLELDTCLVESFDESRLKKLLGVPANLIVPVIIPIGYALDEDKNTRSIRAPLNQRLYLDVYTNPVKKINT